MSLTIFIQVFLHVSVTFAFNINICLHQCTILQRFGHLYDDPTSNSNINENFDR